MGKAFQDVGVRSVKHKSIHSSWKHKDSLCFKVGQSLMPTLELFSLSHWSSTTHLYTLGLYKGSLIYIFLRLHDRGLNFTLAGPGTGNYPKSLWSPRVQAHFTCTILSVHTSPLLESWMSWQNRRNIGHAHIQDTHETVNYQSGLITTGRVIIIAPHSHTSVTCHVLMEDENPNRDKWIPSSTNKIENCINY